MFPSNDYDDIHIHLMTMMMFPSDDYDDVPSNDYKALKKVDCNNKGTL